MRPLLHAAALLGLTLVTLGNDASKAPLKPFLGVHVVGVPEEVRAQTELDEGSGLMIDFIKPDSPASQGGLKMYDILTKIEDQKLLSAEQFSNLIKSSKTGEPINLGILRAGKPITLQVKLVEAPENSVLNPSSQAQLNGLNELLAKNPEAAKVFPEILKHLRTPTGPTGPMPPKTKARSLVMADTDGTVEITEDDNDRTALVKDPAGAIVFQGSIRLDEQRSALEPAVRSRIEKLEQSAKSLGKAP
jgi:membrane-associated protease RseP (regulator of RpoE activity)